MWRDLFSAAKAKYHEQQKQLPGPQSERAGTPGAGWGETAPSLSKPTEDAPGAASAPDAASVPFAIDSAPSSLPCFGPQSSPGSSPSSLALPPPASVAGFSPLGGASQAVPPRAPAGEGLAPAGEGLAPAGEGLAPTKPSSLASKPRKPRSAASGASAAAVEGGASQAPKPKKPRTVKNKAQQGAPASQDEGTGATGDKSAAEKSAPVKRRVNRSKGAGAASAKKEKAPGGLPTPGGGAGPEGLQATPPPPQQVASQSVSLPYSPSPSSPSFVSAPEPPASVPSGGAEDPPLPPKSPAAASAPSVPTSPLRPSAPAASSAASSVSSSGSAPAAGLSSSGRGAASEKPSRGRSAAAATACEAPAAGRKEGAGAQRVSAMTTKGAASPARPSGLGDTLGKFAAILATSQRAREKKKLLTEGDAKVAQDANAGDALSAADRRGEVPQAEIDAAAGDDSSTFTHSGDAGTSDRRGAGSLPALARVPSAAPAGSGPFGHAEVSLGACSEPFGSNEAARRHEGGASLRSESAWGAAPGAEDGDGRWHDPASPLRLRGQERQDATASPQHAKHHESRLPLAVDSLAAHVPIAFSSPSSTASPRAGAEAGGDDAQAREAFGAATAAWPPGFPSSAFSENRCVGGLQSRAGEEMQTSRDAYGTPAASPPRPAAVPPFGAAPGGAVSASPVEVVDIDDEESLGSEDDEADGLAGDGGEDGDSEGEEEDGGKRYVPFRFIRGLWVDVESEGLEGPEEEDDEESDDDALLKAGGEDEETRGTAAKADGAVGKPQTTQATKRKRERPAPPPELRAKSSAALPSAPIPFSFPFFLDFRASVEAVYGGESAVRDPRTLEAAIFQAAPQPLTAASASSALATSLSPSGSFEESALPEFGLSGRNAFAGDLGGGNLQYRPSQLELCVASIEQRLARQRLVANPRDILRGGGGAGGVYYDKDDAFLDDSEMFREFGMDPAADFEDQQTESGAATESVVDEDDLYEGVDEFICDNDPTMEDSEPEEVECGQKKNRKVMQDEERFNPFAWRRYRNSLKQNMNDDAFNVLLDMEEELKALHEAYGEDAAPQAIEKIMVKHLRKAYNEQQGTRNGPGSLVELNWPLVNKLGGALHAIARGFGVFLVHKTWVRRTLVHNSTVYEYLLLQLFEMIKKSPLFKKDDPAVINKVQEAFEAWQRVSDDSKNGNAFLAVPFAPLLFGGDRTQHLKEVELTKSPLLRVGAIIIDMAVIFHLRRNGLREYVELGLGAESDLQPDKEQHFPQFLRGLLKQAVVRRFGSGVRLTVSAAYLKALVAHLKARYNVNLYERRARRFRELQFQTVVCRAAVESPGPAPSGAAPPGGGAGGGVSAGKGGRQL
ncbi:hypothetical protein BESB_068160 [Besnoitia besnoiti]|uniref:Hpc2-related domain-containing protein n=1 Tax=Besnoitia besnoiti TaxID=94643 RepID=A0A2A9MGK0_BESBE|nr:hypothetical protein BESB_068160 [Besnoitia besnoiti]PFH34783.1 hypothetical protein BESB_068160 [Besnoitia besnoiti]